MIHPNDTGPRTERPECLRGRNELTCTVESIKGPLRDMGAAFHFEETDVCLCDLYIDPKFYHEARTLIWWTVPAFVYVRIIPMEFTS